jgi:hypothetical protein
MLSFRKLRSGFIAMTLDYPVTAEDSVRRMAVAYERYAADAVTASGTPVFDGTERSAISKELLRVMKGSEPSVLSYSDAWYKGIVNFWSAVQWTPPIGYLTGTVTTPPPQNIRSLLTKSLSASIGSSSEWAQVQSKALHNGVLGIMAVTYPPDPPTPSPLVEFVL